MPPVPAHSRLRKGPKARAALAGGIAAALILMLIGFSAKAFAATCPVPQTASGAERWAGQARWQALAAKGYRIGKVGIAVENVFAPSEPDSKQWYAKAANAIHIKTRPGVIRSLLPFKSGDPVKPQVIYETLRRLRAQSFVRAATITPAACEANHTVAVSVRIKDAWTLKLDLSFAHIGGGNIFNFTVEDADFLGFGKKVGIGHVSNPQRSGDLVLYQDPALAGSRWQLFAQYQRLSDGYSKSFAIGRPFYEDTAPWATNFGYLDQRENLNFYNDTELAWRASDHVKVFRWGGARLLSFAGDTGYRLGMSYFYGRYDYGPLQSFQPDLLPPPVLTPRTLSGPAITWQLFQDHYASFRNLALIGRTEDYNLGWNLGTDLGYYATALGSTAPAWYGGLRLGYGMQLPDSTLMFFSALTTGRHEDGEIRNLLTNVSFTFYNQSFPRQTLAAHASLNDRLRPDPENYLYLGGVDGLRGYPNFFLIGDRRWTTTFADRIVTPWQIAGIFQIGFVGYFEAGQIHQLAPSAWSRVYSDVGAGLRIGNLKGSFGKVIFLTIAKPLVNGEHVPGYEIQLGNLINF